MDKVAGKSSALQVLLSSTPTPRTSKRVFELIAGGEDIAWRGDSNETLLHLVPSCARTSNYVKFLLPVVYQLADAGVDVDAVDVHGNTALHVCVLCDAGCRMAGALTRVGVVADRRNDVGETAADIAVALNRQPVVDVLKAAASGLWAAVMNGEETTARRLVESLWFRVDLRRNGSSLLAAATADDRIPDSLVRSIEERGQLVRLMHRALAGNVDAVHHQLQHVDSGAAQRQLRDARYCLDDGTATDWPLLAQVLQLGLTEVARVLIEQGNFDVNASMMVDRRVPLFQWGVHLVGERDEAVLRLLVDRADLSLIVDAADFVYELWQRRRSALVFNLLAARDQSLVTARDSHGRTLRDRILLDTYGATDVMKISALYVDEFVLNLVETGKVSCLERLAMAGYEHINVVDRRGRTASQKATDAKLTTVVDFLDSFPQFQVS